MIKTRIFLFLLMATLVVGSIPAQESAGSNDVVVVLDISGSMNEAGVIQDVRAYLEESVVRRLLKQGDQFTLILFGEDARTSISRSIKSPEDLEKLSEELAEIQASDDFTDLGMAMESLEAALVSRADGSAAPLAFFITDGKNAPPPSSPYADRDISVDERFQDNGRKITMKGWKLYVIGLGESTDAETVAAVVEGSTLVPTEKALDPVVLETYVAETKEITEERVEATEKAVAEKTAAEKTAAQLAEKDRAEAAGSSRFPIIPIAIAVVLLIGLVLFILLRMKKKDKDEEPPSQAA